MGSGRLSESTQQRPAFGSRFITQVMMLAGSAAIGQVIVVASAPIVSRLFSPADFGISSGYSFVLTILQAVNSLRYEFAIPLPGDDTEASNLVGLTIFLVIFLSLLFSAIVLVFSDTIVHLLNEPRVKELLPLLPFALIAGGVVLAFNYWLTRRKQFSILSLSQLGGSIGQVAGQLVLGVAQFGAFGLALSFIIGQVASVIVMATKALPLPNLQPRTWPTLAARYKKFPLVTAPASLIDILGSNLPSVLFLAFFSATEAGYFSLTMRIMSLPLGIISNAIAQIFYPHLSDKRDNPEALRQFFDDTASLLFVVALAGFGFVLVAGDSVFALVFGSNWLTAGVYARMLAPYFLMAFLTSLISTVALVYNRQQEVLWYGIATVVLRILALLISAVAQSPALAVALYSVTGILTYLVYLVRLMNLTDLRFSRWLWRQRTTLGLFALAFAGFGAFFVRQKRMPAI